MGFFDRFGEKKKEESQDFYKTISENDAKLKDVLNSDDARKVNNYGINFMEREMKNNQLAKEQELRRQQEERDREYAKAKEEYNNNLNDNYKQLLSHKKELENMLSNIDSFSGDNLIRLLTLAQEEKNNYELYFMYGGEIATISEEIVNIINSILEKGNNKLNGKESKEQVEKTIVK